ncbi:hypothetical protein DSECCO2_545180 [anaerobic digester metagenome]
MPRVDVSECLYARVDDPVEEGDEHPGLCIRGDEGVGLADGLAGAPRHQGVRPHHRPRERHEERCRDAFPGDVGDNQGGPVPREGDRVVEIAADLLCREGKGGEVDARNLRQPFGEETHLDIVRDPEFGLLPLEFREEGVPLRLRLPLGNQVCDDEREDEDSGGVRDDHRKSHPLDDGERLLEGPADGEGEPHVERLRPDSEEDCTVHPDELLSDEKEDQPPEEPREDGRGRAREGGEPAEGEAVRGADQAGAEPHHRAAREPADHGTEVADVCRGAEDGDAALGTVDGERPEEEDEDCLTFPGDASLEDLGERCRPGDQVGGYHDDTDHLQEHEEHIIEAGERHAGYRPGCRSGSRRELIERRRFVGEDGEDPVKPCHGEDLEDLRLRTGYPERSAVSLQPLQRGEQHPEAGAADIVEVAEADEEASSPGVQQMVYTFFHPLRRTCVEPSLHRDDIDAARSSLEDLNTIAHCVKLRSNAR